MFYLSIGFLIVLAINNHRDANRIKEEWKDWAIVGLICVVLDFLIFVL